MITVERLHEQPWFARVCDVPSAFASRGYAPDTVATLELEVHDELVPDNAGRWIVEIANGTATVRRGGDGRLRIDIGALAPMITGYATPDDDSATSAMAGPPPWMSDVF